jgi:hypothetical protein
MQVLEKPITAFAFCPDSRCVGNDVAEVAAIKATTEWQYVDSGGDMPGVERTADHLRFADETADATCASCGKTRELSATPRPDYPSLTGHRQDGLLHVQQFDPAKAQREAGARDATVAELMRQVQELSNRLNAPAAPAAAPAPVAPAPTPEVLARQVEADARRREALERGRATAAANRAAKKALEGGE